jgi:hypothetical protein
MTNHKKITQRVLGTDTSHINTKIEARKARGWKVASTIGQYGRGKAVMMSFERGANQHDEVPGNIEMV